MGGDEGLCVAFLIRGSRASDLIFVGGGTASRCCCFLLLLLLLLLLSMSLLFLFWLALLLAYAHERLCVQWFEIKRAGGFVVK